MPSAPATTPPSRELWPAIEAALAWIDGSGDPDGDGFVEYHRATEQGLANQGWKDSHDAIFHADGRLAEGPIALAEVQGYVYAAKRLAARCARAARPRRSDARRARGRGRAPGRAIRRRVLVPGARHLRARARRREAAVPRAQRPTPATCCSPASPGRSARARSRDGLLRPHFFSGWGIRTVADGEARYNPMSYHNGSIWPHDNALIALGLARYGLKRSVERVFKGLFDAATYMELRRLPELFCGFQRGRGRGPTLYPVACSPQAWASATPFTLIEASLGLEFDPAANEIRLHNPSLPSFLDEVVLRNLHLKDSSVDLKVRRHANDVSVEILERRGDIQVSIVFGRNAGPDESGSQFS